MDSGLCADHMALDICSGELVTGAGESMVSKYGAMNIFMNDAGVARDNVMLPTSS
jgi:hypothetical protein